MSEEGLRAFMGYAPPDVSGCLKVRGEPLVGGGIILNQMGARRSHLLTMKVVIGLTI